MLRFFWYPQWASERAEKMVESMEEKGYRLENISCFWFFKFKTSKPKPVRYFFSYYWRNNRIDLTGIDMELQRSYAAHPVRTGNFSPNVYRIATREKDISFALEARRGFFCYVLGQWMMADLFLLVISLLCCFFEPSLPVFFMMSISLFCLIYHFVGYLHCRAAVKQNDSE